MSDIKDDAGKEQKSGKVLTIAVKALTTALLAPPLLSVTLLSTPESFFSNDFNSVAAEKGIAAAYTKNLDTDHIRVYGRKNPLVPFHAAGAVVVDYRQKMEDRIQQMGLDVGEGQVLERALSVYFPSLRGISKLSLKAAFGDGTTAYAASFGREGRTCYILPPGDMNVAELIAGLTDIDAGHFRKFAQTANISDKDAFTFAFVHEATHCSQVEEGHLLGKETEADLGFVKESLAQTGHEDMAKLVLYTRAIGAFSKQDMDIDHATAVGIAAALNKQAQPNPDAVSGDIARLRQIVDQRVSQVKSGQERFVAVYHVMKEMLKNNELPEGTMKQAAELYTQGVEYLAPEAVAQTMSVFVKAPEFRLV